MQIWPGLVHVSAYLSQHSTWSHSNKTKTKQCSEEANEKNKTTTTSANEIFIRISLALINEKENNNKYKYKKMGVLFTLCNGVKCAPFNNKIYSKHDHFREMKNLSNHRHNIEMIFKPKMLIMYHTYAVVCLCFAYGILALVRAQAMLTHINTYHTHWCKWIAEPNCWIFDERERTRARDPQLGTCIDHALNLYERGMYYYGHVCWWWCCCYCCCNNWPPFWIHFSSI